MEDSQTTIEMETHPPKPPTYEPIKLPEVHIQQMDDNQTTTKLLTEPLEADTE